MSNKQLDNLKDEIEANFITGNLGDVRYQLAKLKVKDRKEMAVNAMWISYQMDSQEMRKKQLEFTQLIINSI